jgi:2-hydroxychromene-2-carboxylate isomerase
LQDRDTVEIRSILDELGQPGAELVEQAQTPKNKQRLRKHTQRAIELGIFGAPSFEVDTVSTSGAMTAWRTP